MCVCVRVYSQSFDLSRCSDSNHRHLHVSPWVWAVYGWRGETQSVPHRLYFSRAIYRDVFRGSGKCGLCVFCHMLGVEESLSFKYKSNSIGKTCGLYALWSWPYLDQPLAFSSDCSVTVKIKLYFFKLRSFKELATTGKMSNTCSKK